MDPNATLERIRTLVAAMLDRSDTSDETDELVQAIDNLDTWISRGGFLPEAWQATLVRAIGASIVK